jgi:hypothetical protein
VISRFIKIGADEIFTEFYSIAWSIDNAGDETKKDILKLSCGFNKLIYSSLVLTLLSGIIQIEVFGRQDQIVLSAQTFDAYFKWCSDILRHIFFLLLFPIYYSNIQYPYLFLYFVQQTQVQIFMVNRRLAQLSHTFDHLDDWTKIRDSLYQQDIYTKLGVCAKHHISFVK